MKSGDFHSIWKRIWAALKGFCTKNAAIKVVALLFAILLWGYVLTDQNPSRTKTVTNVPTSFEGEAELLAQGLCVRGDRAAILSDVTVQVRTQIAYYAALTANQISATISLRNISEARTYELPVNATVSGGYGVVQSVTPGTVSVEIDTRLTKTIPVTTVYTGTLPDGYWADMSASSVTTRVDVEGPKTDIERIKRAECVVDLSDCTSTIYSTYDIILYDENDEVISPDILIGTVPTSTVRIPIYPVKTVPVNVKGSLEGLDNLAVNHELFSATATPQTVRLVGQQSVLDEIDSVLIKSINVSGMSEPETFVGEIIVPENTRLAEGDGTVSVSLDIRESTDEQIFEQLVIEVENLADGLEAELEFETVDLRVSGRISLVSVLKRSDAHVLVDVVNLSAGEYYLDLFPFVRDEDATVELTTEMTRNGESVSTVKVILRERAG